MTDQHRVLYLDPFHGGSHAAVATALARHSRHAIRVLGMPARAWKWRMRGAALWFAELLAGLDASERRADLILTTDMLSAADLVALLPVELRGRPLAVYFHENQLTYPDRGGDERDQHFAFTNLTSALASTEVWFNSHFHRQAMLEAIPRVLARYPDRRPREVARRIERHSRVIYPGIEAPATRTSTADIGGRDNTPARHHEGPPLILWNHRWEHDKAPDACFAALEEVKRRGGRFRLAVAGERFAEAPAVFAELPERFASELVHWGHAEPERYASLLVRADLVISTARHDFFGLAVLEAIAAGAYPLLPARLSYPELLPREFHDAHLYASEEDLVGKVLAHLRRSPPPRSDRLARTIAERFAWPARIGEFDAAIAGLAAR